MEAAKTTPGRLVAELKLNPRIIRVGYTNQRSGCPGAFPWASRVWAGMVRIAAPLWQKHNRPIHTVHGRHAN